MPKKNLDGTEVYTKTEVYNVEDYKKEVPVNMQNFPMKKDQDYLDNTYDEQEKDEISNIENYEIKMVSKKDSQNKDFKGKMWT